MDQKTAKYATTDEYIALFPPEIREKLVAMRATIRAAAPEATEKISYGMPTFFLKKNLVHFAAFKDHIGFFPAASGVAAFASELEGYATSKGTIRFPLTDPLPLDLVRKIVVYRVAENLGTSKK
jgi:uncharacterized protein YdhG (YjbR/CyaY superfamily)